ncbi:MAG: DUF1573 domain-containing protein [Bacteroidia bacterium]|nr:DUF1573 domain-containing protein [Bacteroidia bacterium]
MTIKLTLFAALFAICGVATAQITPAPAATPPAATLVLDNEIHDFGKIIEGTQAKHVFTFTNTGKEPIVIQNAQASCGCTVPSFSKEPVMPGQTGTITAVFDSNNKEGNFAKTITVSSNAAVVYLTIKGFVVKKQEKPKSPIVIGD